MTLESDIGDALALTFAHPVADLPAYDEGMAGRPRVHMLKESGAHMLKDDWEPYQDDDDD